MKTFTVLFAVLLVALFITTEAKPWGRPGRGNNRPGRPGRRDDRPDQCIRRCPRPNQDTLVCVFDGVRNRTLPSECILERIECISGRRNMEITDGPCPDDVALYMNGMLSMETESEEDSSEESREDGSTPGQPTSVPVDPSTAAVTSRTTTPTTGTASPTTLQTTTPTTATATATAPTTTATAPTTTPITMPIGSGATAQSVPTQRTPP
ncbi:mucin-2-like [Asterias rubens]|uniref:mucin-2-like n=1 Tax=Asterias rubens TaxID=7604 RepID=UPI001455127F|nr:mucin-2-like [Asterias rubens]